MVDLGLMHPTSRKVWLVKVICSSHWALEYNKSFRRASTIINNDLYCDVLKRLKQQAKDFKQPICPQDLATQYFSGKYAPI